MAATVVPDQYLCPITLEIMRDPVTTVDGITYERVAIADWLANKDTSPLSGALLSSKELVSLPTSLAPLLCFPHL